MRRVYLYDNGQEGWFNGTYGAMATRREDGSVRLLTIIRLNRGPLHDWRDLQEVKNQICGAGCEACELYPAESRTVDIANHSHLWVLPPGQRFPFGFQRGVKSEDEVETGRQRPFAADYRKDASVNVSATARSPDSGHCLRRSDAPETN
jgi:hypothetical protein